MIVLMSLYVITEVTFRQLFMTN